MVVVVGAVVVVVVVVVVFSPQLQRSKTCVFSISRLVVVFMYIFKITNLRY